MQIDEYDIEDMTDVVEQVVPRYLSKYYWADKRELVQESWRTVLAARKTWDPKVGVTLEAYLYKSAVYSLQDFVCRARTVAYVPHRERKKAFELSMVPIDSIAVVLLALTADSNKAWSRDPCFDWCTSSLPPDTQYEKEERRHALMMEVYRVFTADKEGHLAKEVLLDGTKSAKVAEKYGIPVSKVYNATKRVTLTLGNNPTLYKLWRDNA